MSERTHAFPLLIANTILHAGCHQSVAERVYDALCDMPQDDCMVLWLRIQGRSYRDIAQLLDINKDKAWRIVHGPIKRSVYSIFEHSTHIPHVLVKQ
jgi:hypothetical protein